MKSSIGRSSVVLSGVALILAAAGQAMAVDCTTTPIALTGTNGVLGPNQGAATFTFLGSANPALNNNGQAIFRADTTLIANSGNPGSAALWVYSGGVNNPLVAQGDAAPGGGTYTGGFNSPIINDSAGTGWRDSTIALYSNNGSSGKVMKNGDAAVGTGGGVWSSISNPSPTFNGAGQTAFVASMPSNASATPPIVFTSGIANSSGLWAGAPGSVALVVRQNDGITTGSTSDPVRFGSLSTPFGFNDNSKLLFRAALQGTVTTGAASGNDQAIFSNRNGGSTFEMIARRGDAVPGLEAGAQYRNIDASSAINNAGKIAFVTTIRGGNAGTSGSNYAVMTDTAGSLAAYCRTGTTTGMPIAGATWNGFYSDTVINKVGTVAFKGNISGPGITSGTNDTAIFKISNSGAITMGPRQGDAVSNAISTVSGETVLLGGAGFQGGFSMNSLGQVAFTSGLRSVKSDGSAGTGVNGAIGNNIALLATDVDGTICMIAQKNTAFQVAPGDIRIVSALGGFSVNGGESGAQLSFSNNGDLIYSLSFADGTSGVFLTHIPAPGAAGLMGMGGLLVARRRRR